MNKHQKEIDELDSEIYVAMGNYSQIVIDIVADATDLKGDKDELGAFCYSVSILKEVFDPKRDFDISILDRLEKIIRDWLNELE